jgi:hypothetical protein
VGGARGCSLHVIGQDADGKLIRPVHNDVGSLWILDGARDGPFAFEAQFYDKEARELPISTQCHLRFDPGNQAAGGIGAWRWQSSCAFYIPPEEFVDPREPTPPTPPLPPVPDPRDPRKPTPPLPGGDEFYHVGRQLGGDLGGNQGPIGSVPGGGEPPDTDLAKPGGSLIDQFNEAINPLRPFGNGGTPVIGDQSKPTYPTSPNCVAVPNVMLIGAATASGELNITGARTQTAQTLAIISAAPHVAHFAAIAAGDGTWAGFSSTPGSATAHPTATGMVLLLPADVTVNQVASGTADAASTAQLAIPSGMSEVVFGTPNATTGRVGSGVTIYPYAGGIRLAMVDADGEIEVGAPRMSLGEGGTDFVGNVSVSGKLDVAGRFDPTTVEFTDQVTDDIPDGSAGLRFDSATNARPLWKQKAAPYTQGPLALYSDVTIAVGKTRLLYGTEQATGTSLTYSMPASTMDNDGDVLVIYGRGITGTTGVGSHAVRLRLGSTTIFDLGGADLGTSDPWEFTARVIRKGASSQVAYVTFTYADSVTNNGQDLDSPGARITATEALTSGTLDLVLDYSNGSAPADRIVYYLEVELREAP